MTKMDGSVLIIGLIALFFVVPWLVGKVFDSGNRHVFSRQNNQRSESALGSTLTFSIAGVGPEEVVRAVVEEAGFPKEAKLVASSAYITGVEADGVEFAYGKTLGNNFTSVLVVESIPGGTTGEYGVSTILEYGGRLGEANLIDLLEKRIRTFLQGRFPSTEFGPSTQ